MLPLVMIPALCCDEGFYDDVKDRFADLASPQIVIPYENTLAACVERVLNAVEGDFIIMSRTMRRRAGSS